jgi:DNA-binding MarR family transcriptional regulator
MSKTIKQTNKDIKEFLTEDKFEKRVRKLLKLGLVEIVDVEEDGSPIVKVTEQGLQLALDKLESEK